MRALMLSLGWLAVASVLLLLPGCTWLFYRNECRDHCAAIGMAMRGEDQDGCHCREMQYPGGPEL